MNLRLIILFFCLHFGLYAQEIRLQLIDSTDQVPLPFATITTNFGENAVTNEEGFFKLTKETAFSKQDSLFISSMGFTPYKAAVESIKDSIISLSSKAIELNAVILSQNNLSATQIIQKAKEKVFEKYDRSLSKKTFFLRESYYQKWTKREMKVKKATIKEFKQSFWDSLLQTIPIKDSWHTESFGELHGDWSEENQKLVLLRAVELADTINEKGYEQVEKKITTLLDDNTKEQSYFKFKSGIFSTKVDREEIIELPKDSTDVKTAEVATQEKEKEKHLEAEAFYRSRKNKLKGVFRRITKRDRLDFEVLRKSQNYTFEIVNFTYMEDTPVYQISFQPKGKKGKFKGMLYIEADEYSLIQIDYENTRILKDFSLFGLSYNFYGRTYQLKFNRFQGGPYQLQYLRTVSQFKTGIERPFKVLEKNKHVKGRRKQNELSGQINFKLDDKVIFTLVVFDNQKTTQENFDKLTETKTFVPEKRNAFDPSFWEGYTIMEPNEGIKSFRKN